VIDARESSVFTGFSYASYSYVFVVAARSECASCGFFVPRSLSE
jgi:hypothetical protein